MLEYRDIVKSLYSARKENKGVTIIKSQDEEKYISYDSLWKASSLVCEHLRKSGAQKNSEVIIQCKNTEYYMYAFWACAIGGFIAVPIDVSNNDYMTASNKKIIELMDCPFLLYDDVNNITADTDTFAGKSINVSGIDYTVDTEIDNNYDDAFHHQDDIMYIQFSSGSTGEPKGSVLRRYNISANSQAIIKGLQMDTSDTSISWQPLTHCYGLTFFHLIPIMLNVSHYLIPTDVFLKSPMLWLEKVHEHRITRAGMIPFALRHFMNYYEKSATPEHWDLSCLKSMTLGAEQVKPELCTSFTALMAKHKLGADVPKPGYGLTESTACASVTGMDQTITGHYLKCANMGIGQVVDEKADALAPDTVSFVEIGEPLEGVELRILNDEGSVLPENTIGYLYVKGDNITTGYHKKPKETAALLSADGWLNTGDIGFIKNKRLVVIGRQKEVIVVNGLKYLCNELEDIINKGIINNPFGQIAVCNGLSKERNTEQAVVFVEMELDYAKAKDVSEFLAFSRQIKEIVFVTMELLIDSVLPIDRLPRTKSGKMKRKELGDRYNSGEFLEAMNRLQTAAKKESENVHASVDDSAGLSEKQVLNTILEIIDKLFGFDVSDYDLSFQDHGVMSSDVPFFIDEINRVFDLDISVSAFFGYPNINQLSSFIHKLYKAKSETTSEKPAETIMLTETEKVAIVGMSCRFPGGANSVDEFWELLITQRDGISDVPETRWDLEKYYDADENIPGKMYCKKGGFLNVPINEFDARFFNISPKEALAMDPQQRLLLELIWESFENAGIDIGKCKGKDTGVYLGISSNEYMMAHLNSGELSRIDAYSLTGACASTACGRISYTFGFEGPCIAVDTACSSALSALHIAHQSIKNGETRLAVVGGVNLMLSPSTNVGFSKLHATSPSGQSKAFDASADGYGRSEGAGVLILKSLSDAIRDNDQILGVIRSTSINQDGRSNGLTAPNGMAQERLIGEALRKAGLSATDVDYVEMHGTGTPLGDPIEVNAVANTYGTGRGFDNPLRIGSVKSNVGHMEAAAGIASMIKVLLSFKNNVIPGNLHFNEPNPLIDWPRLNVNVVGEHSEWINKNDTRRAGINGFGFGGSNAHVIIEEYIAPEKAKATEPRQIMNYILKISARCDDSLRRLVEKYYQVIAECDESALSDIILSAARGRADFECRIAVTGSSKEDLLYKLEAYLTGEQPEGLYYSDGSNPVCLKGRQPVFMFTGQGSQYIKMGKPLYESSSVFKDALDECDRLFKPYLLTSIIDLIYSEKASNETIEKTCYAQPLIFSIEYALFKLLTHYGVMPEIVMGHSIGEYAAAVVSGVISLSDAAKLVSARGRLMDMAPGEGGMGTIFAAQSVVETMIENYSGEVTIAACNAKETYVISGKKPLVEQILNDAEAAGYKVNRLKVSHGFHSPLMMPILDNFDSVAKEIQYASPKIRFVSAVHAAEIGKDKALDHTYWTEHIVKRVDFYNAVMSIDKPENYAFIEIGSHRVLSSLLKLIFDSDKTVVGTLNRKKEDGSQMANTIAELYVAGVDIDWEKVCFSTDMGWKRYTLPTYQFERESYWRDLLFDRPVSYTPTDGVSRLLGQKIESPALNGGVIFQSKFTAQEPYFIKEHIIFKMPISPAAAHVSMILSAVNELGKPGTCTLKSIELWTPLAVDVDEQRTVQVCLSNIDNKVETDFSIISKSQTSDDAEWLKHVQGKFTSSERVIDSQITLDISLLKDGTSDFEASTGIYRMMEESGFELGESFQRITKACALEGEDIYYIEPLEDVPHMDMYIMYPGIIDSIFQTMLCNIMEEAKKTAGNKTMIPYYIEEITYNYIPYKTLWCRAHTELKDDVVHGSSEIFNESGEIIMKISNFTAKLTDRATLLRATEKNYNSFYYHTEWMLSDKASRNTKADKPMKYISISNNAALLEKICGALQKERANAEAVFIGKSGASTYSIDDITQKSNWMLLLSQINEDNKDERLKFIYHYETVRDAFGSGSAGGNIDFLALRGLSNLTQSIIESGLEGKASIKILTANVQNPDDSKDKLLNLSQSLLWGYAKVLSIEYSDIFDGIIDFDDGSVNDLAEEIARSGEYELCLHNGASYTPVLRRHKDYLKRNIKNPESIKILPAGSYLITGGTGALGMVYAEYLVNSGAKNIFLLDRKQPSEDVDKKINELKGMGASIRLLFADINDKYSLATALSSIKEEFPAIRGVIHAAGALNDKMIADLSWEDFEIVLGAKVAGLANLYGLLDLEQVDFLMLLSSVTSAFGNVGQANYAAANYFLNTFANDLAFNNQKAFTPCWGPWLSGGMASSNELISKNIAATGIEPIAPDIGLEIISGFFERPFKNPIIVDINWNIYMNNLNAKPAGNYLSQILSERSLKKSADENKQIAANVSVDKLNTCPQEERKTVLSDDLQKICGNIMGFGKGQRVDKNIAIKEQGADSLMVFSMRSTVNKLYSVDLSVSDFFDYPTINRLSDHLIDDILFAQAAEDMDSIDNESTEDLLFELEALAS